MKQMEPMARTEPMTRTEPTERVIVATGHGPILIKARGEYFIPEAAMINLLKEDNPERVEKLITVLKEKGIYELVTYSGRHGIIKNEEGEPEPILGDWMGKKAAEVNSTRILSWLKGSGAITGWGKVLNAAIRAFMLKSTEWIIANNEEYINDDVCNTLKYDICNDAFVRWFAEKTRGHLTGPALDALTEYQIRTGCNLN